MQQLPRRRRGLPALRRTAWPPARCLLPVALILALALAGCGAGDPAPALAGRWSLSQDLGGGFSSYLTWGFTGGRFTLEGYPPLRQAGRFRLIAQRENTYRLQLYDQSGDLPTDDRELLVVYDPQADTLLIDGQGPYHRVAEAQP